MVPKAGILQSLVLFHRSTRSVRGLVVYITSSQCVPMVEVVCGNNRKPVRRAQKS